MNMLNTRFSVSLIVIGWLCLSASLCAQPLSFMAPEKRPQLEASKPRPENQFLVPPTTTLKMMPPISATSPFAPAR